MRVLFDTNVVLDVLLRREPHALDAARLLSMADTGVIDGVLCADALTTVDYIAAKVVGPTHCRRLLSELLRIFAIVPVDRGVLESALRLDFPDFEDAVVQEAARACGAAAIVMCDAAGFSHGSLPVLEPVELFSALVAGD